jgi:hypothetical protein
VTAAIEEARWIEIDLSDLGLAATLSDRDQVALATAHVYERFVPYADQGWVWVDFPSGRDFDGWVLSGRTIAGVRIFSRRGHVSGAPAANGVSAYRTRQLTGRPWTSEPGSKRWRSFPHAP